MKCIYCMNNNSDTRGLYESGVCEICGANLIEEYKQMLIDLIPFAETEIQREALNYMVEIFRNRFKREEKLFKHNAELVETIYKFNSQH